MVEKHVVKDVLAPAENAGLLTHHAGQEKVKEGVCRVSRNCLAESRKRPFVSAAAAAKGTAPPASAAVSSSRRPRLLIYSPGQSETEEGRDQSLPRPTAITRLNGTDRSDRSRRGDVCV